MRDGNRISQEWRDEMALMRLLSESSIPDIIPPEHQGRWIAWTSDGLHILGSGDSVAAARKAAGAYPDPLIAWSPRAGELRAVPRGSETT